MRLAIIDMGTNSIRYSIYEGESASNAELIYKQKDMVRPGQGVFTTGRIDEKNLDKITDSFSDWKKISQKYAVDKTISIATCAMRTANNADDVLKHIKKSTGFEVKVISGAEEARLIALGLMVRGLELPTRAAFVDIGGGSTEISLVESDEILWSHSFPLGSQRLKQLFPKVNPPAEAKARAREIKSLREKIQSKLTPLKKHLKGQSFPHVVGTAGTIKAVGRILNLREARMSGSFDYVKELAVLPDSMEFSYLELKEFNSKLETTTRAALSFTEGLEAKRRDIIIPGSILLEEICSRLKANSIQTSTSSLRDGILLEQLTN